MGVRGLWRFVETQCRSERTVLVSNDSSLDNVEEFTLAVDGVGLAFHLIDTSPIKGQLWRFGGDLRALTQVFEAFAQNLAQGVSTHVFFDAEHKVDAGKLHCTLERRQTQLDQVKAYMKALEPYSLGDLESDETKSQLLSHSSNAFVLPLLAVQCLKRALRNNGIEVHDSTEQAEADPELARYAAANKCIVVTNDSDLFIFQGVERVAHFRDVVFCPDGSLVVRNYTCETVAKNLGIPNTTLSLSALATFSGHDFSHPEIVASLQSSLLRKASQSNNIKGKKKRNKKGRSGRLNHQAVIANAAALIASVSAHTSSSEDFFESLVSRLGFSQSSVKFLQAFEDSFRRYAALPTESSSAESSKESRSCWWWPRPVLETGFISLKTNPESFSIHQILRPLRCVLLGSQWEYGPDGKLNKYVESPPLLDLPMNLRTSLQSAHAKLSTYPKNALLELSRLCLHAAVCAASPVTQEDLRCQNCITQDEYEELCMLVQDTERNERRKAKGPELNRMISLMNLLQAVLATCLQHPQANILALEALFDIFCAL